MRRRALFWPLLAALSGCESGTAPEQFPAPSPVVIEAPPGFPPVPDTPGNPLTRQGIELGRRLFHDPILSANRTQSCSSCHDQGHAFSDHGQRFSVGIDGTSGTRNAPAIVNPAWGRTFFWDGRALTLEDQAREPVPNPIEMHLPWERAIDRLRRDSVYPDLFGAAFGTIEVSQERAVRALAQFERTFVSADSRYDRNQLGEIALSPAEERGRDLFFRPDGECFRCHGTLLFTTHEFHDIGLDLVSADPGRQGVTGDPAHRGQFRTPTLRNVEFTAPYMHDGRFQTLEQVLDHYSEGIQRSPNLATPLARHDAPGLGLTAQEKADLVAFLKALSDPGFLTNPAFGRELTRAPSTVRRAADRRLKPRIPVADHRSECVCPPREDGMPASTNSGEYRSCPFCAELIRRKAIQCKHCNAALDPKKIRRYNRLRAAKGWHLMLGLLMFIVVFTGIYPRVVSHLEQMEHADRSAEERARQAPQLAGPYAPAMPVPRLPLGEEELRAGQSYNGGVLLDLIESNFEIAEIEPDKSIKVSVDGREYLIRTKKTEFSRAASYEIVGIEAVEK